MVGRPARGFPALSDARHLCWRWKGLGQGPYAPGNDAHPKDQPTLGPETGALTPVSTEQIAVHQY